MRFILILTMVTLINSCAPKEKVYSQEEIYLAKTLMKQPENNYLHMNKHLRDQVKQLYGPNDKLIELLEEGLQDYKAKRIEKAYYPVAKTIKILRSLKQ